MKPRDNPGNPEPGDDRSDAAPVASEVAARLDVVAERVDAWPRRIEPDSSYAGAYAEFVVENHEGIQSAAAELKRIGRESDRNRLMSRYKDALRGLNHVRALGGEWDGVAAMGTLSDNLVRQLDEREKNLVARASCALRALAGELRRARDIMLGRNADAIRLRDPASGVRCTAETAAAPHTSTRQRAGGRPPSDDPERDRQIWDAWATRQYRTYAELARVMGKADRDVKLAIDRHRKRRAASRS